jgi:hypothetical protein
LEHRFADRSLEFHTGSSVISKKPQLPVDAFKPD